MKARFQVNKKSKTEIITIEKPLIKATIDHLLAHGQWIYGRKFYLVDKKRIRSFTFTPQRNIYNILYLLFNHYLFIEND